MGNNNSNTVKPLPNNIQENKNKSTPMINTKQNISSVYQNNNYSNSNNDYFIIFDLFLLRFTSSRPTSLSCSRLLFICNTSINNNRLIFFSIFWL